MDSFRAIVGGEISRTSGISCRICAGASPRWCRRRAFDTAGWPASCGATVVLMINRIGIAALWLLGLACVFAAINKNDPYLISLPGAGNAALAVTNIVISVVLIRRGYWRRRGIAGKLLVLLWGLAPILMLGAHITFEVRKRDVLHTNAAQARTLGRHFVVGYSSFEEVAALAERVLDRGHLHHPAQSLRPHRRSAEVRNCG